MRRIGLISDTHTMGKRLPQAVLNAFDGVDTILHAGDLVSREVLDALAEIAPVIAVHGNMDQPETRSALPHKTVIQAEDKRIGLIHGDRVPNPNRVLPPPIDYAALHAYLFSEFAENPPDCIVYGHTHAAHIATYQGVLMVNPGSATRGSGGRNTVGLLVVRDGRLEAEIIPL
ncbi:MAG: metallophosphatase family protein [Anaerolineae bacterium]|nr:metallophosphatase family protein [Anaerolineae bacterium]MDW8070557.1 metallophosphoesterase family protein [Anaerolineae bacterium]